MPTVDEWVNIFNDGCESSGKQWGQYLWEKDDFEVELGEEIRRDYCYQDYSTFTLCDTCEGNIERFNSSNPNVCKLKSRIKN